MITTTFTLTRTRSGIIGLESNTVNRARTRSITFDCSYPDAAVNMRRRNNDTNMIRGLHTVDDLQNNKITSEEDKCKYIQQCFIKSKMEARE